MKDVFSLTVHIAACGIGGAVRAVAADRKDTAVFQTGKSRCGGQSKLLIPSAQAFAGQVDDRLTACDIGQLPAMSVHCYLSGKLGGIQQISARVACDEVDLVLFFRDPLKAEAGSSSEQNLLRLCDMHSVPISTNIATAEVLLRGLDQGDLDYREGIHPDIVEPLPVHRAVC